MQLTSHHKHEWLSGFKTRASRQVGAFSRQHRASWWEFSWRLRDPVHTPTTEGELCLASEVYVECLKKVISRSLLSSVVLPSPCSPSSASVPTLPSCSWDLAMSSVLPPLAPVSPSTHQSALSCCAAFQSPTPPRNENPLSLPPASETSAGLTRPSAVVSHPHKKQ